MASNGATPAAEARTAIASARGWRGFLVDPKLSVHDDVGVRVLAEIASSNVHRFVPRAAISRVASPRLVNAAARLGARYLAYPCDREAFAYFAFEVHAGSIDDEALRAYVTELGVAAGLTAQELATLAAHVAGPHETVGRRLELADSTVATHVRGLLAKMRIFGADASTMHALEAWILHRARRRS